MKNFQNNGRSRTESVIVSRISGIFLRLFMRHTQFFEVDSISEAILEVSREIFSTFCGLCLLLSFKQRDVQVRFWSVFKVGEQVSIIFSIHRFFYEVLDIFPRLSYRLTFIMLNVRMVDNLEFWQAIFEFRGPKHVRFPLPGFSRRRVITFFRISTSLCLFSFQGQNNVISLMDIHVQHLALLCRICGDEIEDHKRKVDTNRFVSEIH